MIEHINGIDLNYEKTGSGRPLVMIHGNGEDHTIFDESVEILRDSFTCYCLDSRGHGASTKVPVLHYTDMAEDVVRFIEKHDLNDVVFYGFSDGGIIGLIAAAKCPRITKLIVSGANITPRGAKLWIRVVINAKNIVKKDPMLELMIKEPHISDDMLKSIRADTLVLAGSRDLIREGETRHIARCIPKSELKILKGETHGSYIEHNEKIGHLIRDFVCKD